MKFGPEKNVIIFLSLNSINKYKGSLSKQKWFIFWNEINEK